MFEVSQIFVPVDTSRGSRAALGLAKSLMGLASAPSLEMVHVLPQMPEYMHKTLFPYAAMGEDEVEFEQELISATKAGLEKLLEPPYHASIECLIGNPKTTLSQHLLSSPANLVVMGAFGEGGPLPSSIGSTAAHIVRTSSHPVLLAKDLHPTPKIQHILCALDLTPNSYHILEVALSLALDLDAKFSAIFILPDPLAQDPHNLLANHLQHSPEQLIAKEQPKLEALFERCFQSINLPFPLKKKAQNLWKKREITTGHVAHTITKYADDVQADLIVLGASHAPESPRPGLTCLDVMTSATTHTLVVPLPHASPHATPNDQL